MAVFLAAGDETGRGDGQGTFFMGGFVAPVLDWQDYFTPAWEERVLKRRPPIPYLHMTEIRSNALRAGHGLNDSEAEQRVDDAVDVIASMGSLYLVTTPLNEGHFRAVFGNTSVLRHSRQPAIDRFEPDHVCFLRFAYISLLHGQQEGAEKVDFLVEERRGITHKLKEFHSNMATNLAEIGREDLAALVGGFTSCGKERAPLQAADLACWHIRGGEEGTLTTRTDYRRFQRLTDREGHRDEWANDVISDMQTRAEANKVPSPFKPKAKPNKAAS